MQEVKVGEIVDDEGDKFIAVADKEDLSDSCDSCAFSLRDDPCRTYGKNCVSRSLHFEEVKL